MEPISAAVREAALQAFAALNPPPPEGAAADGDGEGNGPLFGGPVPPLNVAAQNTFADALAAAFCAGLGPAAITAAAAAACVANAAVREQIRARVAAAALHNDSEEGPEGPQVLLPLADDVLVHFVNRLHSDR